MKGRKGSDALVLFAAAAYVLGSAIVVLSPTLDRTSPGLFGAAVATAGAVSFFVGIPQRRWERAVADHDAPSE